MTISANRRVVPWSSALPETGFGQNARQLNGDRAQSLFQLISGALEGPNGIAPETLVAGFGAFAGLYARHVVKAGVAAELLVDDFEPLPTISGRTASASDQATGLLADMTRDSFISALATSLLARDSQWLPDMGSNSVHAIMSLRARTYPLFTVPAAHHPALDAHQMSVLLAAPLQSVAFERSLDGARVTAAALGQATAMAAQAVQHRLALKVSAQLATEAALAMCLLEPR
ncbi:MAG: hypothetical protein AAFR13_04410 [Pseudomonadota bacterium]